MSITKERILIVDDDPQVREVLEAILMFEDYSVEVVEDAESALSILEKQSFGLVISDINMNGISGVDLLEIILDKYPDIAVVMVTGVDDRETAIRTLHMGAYGYVAKPFLPNEIVINITNSLRRRALEIENRRHREELEILVDERTSELLNSREESIHILSKAAEFRDNETAKHTIRMGLLAEHLSLLCNLPTNHCKNIRDAAPLHDVGKIGISDTILLKPGKLTKDEFEEMKKHCEIGYRILSESNAEIFKLGSEIALSHHEKFDGSGYPKGLVGESIPIVGRIAAVCDVFDALTSERPYKKAFSIKHSLEIMLESRGQHFDPEIFDLFHTNIQEFVEIRECNSD